MVSKLFDVATSSRPFALVVTQTARSQHLVMRWI